MGGCTGVEGRVGWDAARLRDLTGLRDGEGCGNRRGSGFDGCLTVEERVQVPRGLHLQEVVRVGAQL